MLRRPCETCAGTGWIHTESIFAKSSHSGPEEPDYFKMLAPRLSTILRIFLLAAFLSVCLIIISAQWNLFKRFSISKDYSEPFVWDIFQLKWDAPAAKRALRNLYFVSIIYSLIPLLILGVFVHIRMNNYSEMVVMPNWRSPAYREEIGKDLLTLTCFVSVLLGVYLGFVLARWYIPSGFLATWFYAGIGGIAATTGLIANLISREETNDFDGALMVSLLLMLLPSIAWVSVCNNAFQYLQTLTDVNQITAWKSGGYTFIFGEIAVFVAACFRIMLKSH